MTSRDFRRAGRISEAGSASGEVRAGGRLSRRRFLGGGAASVAGMVLGWRSVLASPLADPVAGGKFAGLAPFEDEQVGPAGTLMGSEMDGRLFTDLSHVSRERLITPTDEFFIRTAASRMLPDAAGWKIDLDGLVEKPAAVGMERLRKAARPMGTHLMECAGNVARTRFGLMSVGEWKGVPVSDVLGEAKARPGAGWVEISGFDEYAEPSRTSTPGASWIFPVAWLKDAFLATEMNGRPLSRDHGAPVRLVIPGWYGAACIKWVNRIGFVEEGAEASSQMVEYAVRTLQEGRPQFAREYAPATVDAAALPVRVEKWLVGEKIEYRIVGIVWGGSQRVSTVQIRFNPLTKFEPVTGLRQEKTDPWSVWTYTWTPPAPGDYQIRMAITGPPVQARKLDMGLYDRTVHIGEV